MFKKTVQYADLNGNKKEKDCYFHFFESEIYELEMSEKGGFAETIYAIVQAEDTPTLVNIIKDFVLKAYGVKSPDGERFEKSEEISTAFSQTGAFSALYMELVTDDKAMSEFVNALITDDIRESIAARLKKQQEKKDNTPVLVPVNE